MRKLCVGAVVVGALLWGSGGAGAVPAGRGPVRGEADLAFHGYVALSDGRVRVSLTPRNHGPSDVGDATVRLRSSAPLADAGRLPGACVREGGRGVLCRTGALPAGGWGEPLDLVLPLKGGGQEVTLTVDTAWGGGAVDGNPANNHRVVLALDTGDSYYF
ncbi:hypothetical protein [Streptomyces sp. NPDC059063]|uniref:hypothetical protein n=1 Tax=unclassified Streptomyces TaxID=2593676 RepID=UPI00368AA6E2